VGAGLSGVTFVSLPGDGTATKIFISTSLFLGNVVGYCFNYFCFDSVCITDLRLFPFMRYFWISDMG